MSGHQSANSDRRRSLQLRVIAWLLRVDGGFQLLACLAVLLPRATMSSLNDGLGLAPLPTAPLVGYLARSLSALYALYGTMTMFISFDIERYLPLLRIWSITFTAFGFTLLCVDLAEGMPSGWTLAEGPFVIAFGLLIFGLQATLPPAKLSSE